MSEVVESFGSSVGKWIVLLGGGYLIVKHALPDIEGDLKKLGHGLKSGLEHVGQDIDQKAHHLANSFKHEIHNIEKKTSDAINDVHHKIDRDTDILKRKVEGSVKEIKTDVEKPISHIKHLFIPTAPVTSNNNYLKPTSPAQLQKINQDMFGKLAWNPNPVTIVKYQPITPTQHKHVAEGIITHVENFFNKHFHI